MPGVLGGAVTGGTQGFLQFGLFRNDGALEVVKLADEQSFQFVLAVVSGLIQKFEGFGDLVGTGAAGGFHGLFLPTWLAERTHSAVLMTFSLDGKDGAGARTGTSATKIPLHVGGVNRLPNGRPALH